MGGRGQPQAIDNTPRRKRGPYLQWSVSGHKMPKSTRFSRVSATSQQSQPSFKKNKPRKISQLFESLPKQQTCRVSLPIQTVSPDSPTSPMEMALVLSPSRGSSPCGLDPISQPIPLPSLAPSGQSVTSPTHHEIVVSSPDRVSYQPDDNEIAPGDLLQVELHELDGFHLVGEEDVADDNSFHSEDSFILRLDCSTEEDVDDPLIHEELTSVPADRTESDEDNSSDEEMLAEAPDLFLSVSQRTHILLLLATMKRHNLTYSAAEDIMKLAGVLSESEVFLPPRHLIKRAIEEYSCGLTEHHICPMCEKYNGIISTETYKCLNCSEVVNTLNSKRQGNIFLYLSLKEQLEALLRHPSIEVLNPQERDKIVKSNYEDIYDGKFYKINITGDTLTINFFVDGLQIATTCKKSAWPVLACLNELPLPLRRKHIFLVSLWLSLKKPDCNEYLKPFVAECIRLEESGISFLKNGVMCHFKIKVILGVSDTIARPLLRISTQFNGWYGCGLCLHPGFRMKYQKGYIRSYSTFDQEFPIRNHDQLMEMARKAEETGKPVKGIRGISVLSTLKDFDMTRGLDLDLFHALVNVAKRFAHLWFLEKFKNKPFGLFAKFEEVNSRLLQITPTSDVSRNPRSLKDRSDYRGHEWFHWVVEYSLPVLKGILPSRFFNHWSYLVHGIALIMQNSVAKSELIYASRYLAMFVTGIDHLYGKHHVTISAHLLTHLEGSVSYFGPPWAHSAFIFESFNAEIKQSVKSSNGANLQICKAMQRKIALRKLEEDVIESMSDPQKQYLQTMVSTRRLAPATITIGSASLLGKARSDPLPVESVLALRRAGVQCHEHSSFLSFDRCQLHHEIYQSTNYSRASKQNNSVVLLASNEVFVIHSFVVFNNKCYVLGNIIESNRQQKLCDIPVPHIKVLKGEPESIRRCFPVCDIEFKLLSFSLESQSGVSLRIACINVLKMEMLR